MEASYSFLTPQRKSILSPLTKAWLFYIFLSLVVLAFLWIVFIVQAKRFVQNANDLETKIEQEKNNNKTLQLQLQDVNVQIAKIQNIQEENQAMIEGLSNLFSLVPEQITINSLVFTTKNLTLKGITPSKELYTFLLETPLRAIFFESRADFYVLPSGWFNFVSVSKVSNPSATQTNKETK